MLENEGQEVVPWARPSLRGFRYSNQVVSVQVESRAGRPCLPEAGSWKDDGSVCRQGMNSTAGFESSGVVAAGLERSRVVDSWEISV